MLRTQMVQEGADPSRILSSLAVVIEKQAWEALGLPDFRAFVESEHGLASTADDVAALMGLRHRHETIDHETRDRMVWLRREVKDRLNPAISPPGRPSKGNNVTISEDRGNDADYTLRRLKRDAPALADRVLAGELSANAAAIEAGFRRKTCTVPADPTALGGWIVAHYSVDEIATIMLAIENQGT